MSELDFRAWNRKRKEMDYGSPSYIFDCYGMTPEYIMQFIGLKDKNGKKIYEGDILATSIQWFDPEDILPYDEQPEKKYREVKNMGIHLFHRGDWSIDPEEVEVVGTIYENPDLLEKKES